MKIKLKKYARIVSYDFSLSLWCSAYSKMWSRDDNSINTYLYKTCRMLTNGTDNSKEIDKNKVKKNLGSNID